MSKILKIKSTMTWEEYKASTLPVDIASITGMEHYIKEVHSRWDSYDPEVYLIEGGHSWHEHKMGFGVYLRYTIDEGLTFFAEIQYGGGALTSNGFSVLRSMAFTGVTGDSKVKAMEIMGIDESQWNSITVSDERYSRGDDGRAYFAKTKDTISTQF